MGRWLFAWLRPEREEKDNAEGEHRQKFHRPFFRTFFVHIAKLPCWSAVATLWKTLRPRIDPLAEPSHRCG